MAATAEDERVRTTTGSSRTSPRRGTPAAPRLLGPVRRGLTTAALVSVGACGVLVAVDGRAQPGRSAVALAALVGLALVWTRGVRRASASGWVSAGEAALLGLLMFGAARPAAVLALACLALYHRCFDADGRRVGLGVVTYLVGVGAAAVAAGHVPPASAGQLAALPVVGLLATSLARPLLRHERAAACERSLADLRGRLLAGGDAPVADAVILQAARGIVDEATARLALLEARSETLAVRAADRPGAVAGLDAVPAGGALLHRLAVPGAFRPADLGEPVGDPLDDLLGVSAPGQERVVVPLAVAGVSHGGLVVEQPHAVSPPQVRALEWLAADVAAAQERRALTHALRHSENRFQSLIRHCSDVIAVLDADLVIRYVTPAVRRLLDLEPAELPDIPLRTVVHPNDRDAIDGFLAAAPGRAGETGTAQGRLRRRDGSYVPVEVSGNNLLDDTDVGGLVLTLRDVTERLAFEEQLVYRAFHDPLTDLANRALLGDRMAQALARARRGEGAVALLLVDLDDFKEINDRYGHAAGDALLVGVAERLRRCSRDVDTPARLGGDEFALLLDGIFDAAQARRVALRLLEVFAGPVDLGPVAVPIRGSVGVAVDVDGRGGAEELLRSADSAMYSAKERGKGRVAWVGTAAPPASAR